MVPHYGLSCSSLKTKTGTEHLSHTYFPSAYLLCLRIYPNLLSTFLNGLVRKKSVLTMEFYSAMKKNEILSLASKWMELENIILSEVSQA
jgi:hypothetical protein